jgi:hypothetical protein
MVRGIVYEAAGSVPAADLALGAAEVRRICTLNELPFVLLDEDPGDAGAWTAAARAAIDGLLVARRPTAR